MAARKNIGGLGANEVEDLRDSFQGLMDISDVNRDDERGYYYFAGIHGIPLPQYCEHGSIIFLPWHRAYIYFFEKALQRIKPNIGLPWWDWLSNASHIDGIPDAYSEPVRPDRAFNPLSSSKVWLDESYIDQIRNGIPHTIDWDTAEPQTIRVSNPPESLPKDHDASSDEDWINMDTVQALSEFFDYQDRLENIHNSMHVWCGGTMSVVAVAAFDPIFWSHHAMIDRLWYIWQLGHHSVVPPPSIATMVLEPFNVTVADVWNLDRLEYSYSDASVTVLEE